MEDDERTGLLRGSVAALAGGTEAEVIDGPAEAIHTLLAAVDRHHHAAEVAGRHLRRERADGEKREEP